jgi:glycosyltransferase involved in cell wall biosynthesis
MRMISLRDKLRSIHPDIVQTMTAVNWIALDAALFKLPLGYKLFTGCHTTASVFPLANQKLPWWNSQRLQCLIMRTSPGRLISLATEKCYAATPDCAEVAIGFLGVPSHKIDVCPLGVDTELFHPIQNQADRDTRNRLRSQFGFSATDIVCIYTGRFSEDKNPLLLAQAVAHLVAAGEPFRGLFIGNGAQAAAISSFAGCVVHEFVPVHQLADYFHAADIGVWPTQESMSMLDAAACGLPIVVNDTLRATERIEGNGITYQLNDRESLVRALLSLKDPGIRRKLAEAGAEKMAKQFSWEAIARRRLRDYEIALNGRGTSR